MGMLDGKVAIVTGAGRGIGREEALLLASEGAKVIVNDVGRRARRGPGADVHPAQQTVDDIKAAGGEAALNSDDVSSWTRGREPGQPGRRHLGPARHPGQQRRHPARQDVASTWTSPTGTTSSGST